jgi:hypothetical protein
MEEYNGYSLECVPHAARPQPDRVHRGKHSYTVKTTVHDADNKLCEVLVDVLLRQEAFYVKKAPASGRLGQLSWKKYGSASKAWEAALDRASCGAIPAAAGV